MPDLTDQSRLKAIEDEICSRCASELVLASADAMTDTEDAQRKQTSPLAGCEKGMEEDNKHLDNLDLNNTTTQKKRKKKTKSKSQRGLKAPTGFEDGYADPPQTPAEYEEELQLYHKDIPFIDRIITAIQGFERTRRLIPVRRDIFYKYLAYGSIDVGPNMFQSLDAKSTATESLDKTQLAAAMAQTSIASDKHDLSSPATIYAVDFNACMAGFLSRRAADWFGMKTQEQVELVTSTLERFADYLIQHDVCPEYLEDVLSARNTARQATNELWSIAKAQRWLPGDFNVACSTLFDGQYARDYDGVHDWNATPNSTLPNNDTKPSFIGFTQDTANQIMSLAVAGAADEDVYQDFSRRTQDNSFKVLEIRERAGFEITAIIPPTDDCRKLYRERRTDFRPVGLMCATAWTNPEQPPEDLTADEVVAFASSTARHPSRLKSATEHFTFLVEEVIQRNLFVGMKIEATLHKLNCGKSGLWFFDAFIRCYCSFDVYLCNEMMMGWKKPRMVAGRMVKGLEGWEGLDGVEDEVGRVQDEVVDGSHGDVDGVVRGEGVETLQEGQEGDFEL